MFLAQVLSADGSCRQVVNDAMVKRVLSGITPGSTDTGGYCKARARLPLSMISTLVREAGGVVAQGAASGWHWRSRRVRLVDGATVTLADTVGPEQLVNTETNSDQRSSTIAVAPNGDYVVVWQSNGQDGSGRGSTVNRISDTPSSARGPSARGCGAPGSYSRIRCRTRQEL